MVAALIWRALTNLLGGAGGVRIPRVGQGLTVGLVEDLPLIAAKELDDSKLMWRVVHLD